MDLGDPADPPEPDTVLRLKGEEEIHVHSLLLRLASPVLRIALTAPVANGRRRVDLLDDTVDAWKLLYKTISPQEDDIFSGDLGSKSFPEQLLSLRSLLGLAHKYGVERVVQQACACAQRLILDAKFNKVVTGREYRKTDIREIMLWLDTLQRLDLHSAYTDLYGRVLTGSSAIRKGQVLAMIKKMQLEAPPILLHSQLITDLFIHYVGSASEQEDDAMLDDMISSDAIVEPIATNSEDMDSMADVSSDTSEDDTEEDSEEDDDEDEESDSDDGDM